MIRHEPEKVGMVRHGAAILEVLEEHEIVVIGRTPKALKTLPKEMAVTEQLLGWMFEKDLGMPPDSLSGGRAYTQRGAQYLLDYPVDELGNSWVHLYEPVLRAQRDGLSVGGIAIDLAYPPEMREAEEGNVEAIRKRLFQLEMQAKVMLGYNPAVNIEL